MKPGRVQASGGITTAPVHWLAAHVGAESALSSLHVLVRHKAWIKYRSTYLPYVSCVMEGKVLVRVLRKSCNSTLLLGPSEQARPSCRVVSS